MVLTMTVPAIARHCEEHCDEAIQGRLDSDRRASGPGLLRFARNDGGIAELLRIPDA
jgi:hypothetical protein